MIYGLIVLIALCSAIALTPLVRTVAIRFGAIDHPGARKIHCAAIPRLGGVSVCLSFVVTLGIAVLFGNFLGEEIRFEAIFWKPLFYGGAIVFLVGVWDDVRSVPVLVKLAFQMAAAAVAIWFGVRIDRVSALGGGTLELGVLAIPLTFLWIVSITNAFNLIDGLDGLAAGLAIISAGTSAVIFFLSGNTEEVLPLIILLGALAGFLRYNFNPASIFLGDSGSLLIGYGLAVMSVAGSQKGPTALAIMIPLLTFGLPILDVLLAVARRFVSATRQFDNALGSPNKQLFYVRHIFKADQDHMHHRLIKIGLSHRDAVLVLYALALGLAVLAVVSIAAHYRNALLILFAVGLATYIGIRKLGYEELAFVKADALLQWYSPLFTTKISFLGFVDMLLISGAFWGAFLLKYGFDWESATGGWYLDIFPFVLLWQFAVFVGMGLYRGAWQAMGLGDLIRVSSTVSVAAATSCILSMMYEPPKIVAFFCINMLLLGVVVLGARSSFRILHYVHQRESAVGDVAVIYGAGLGGQLIRRELLQNKAHGLKPIGFLDDDPALRGCTVDSMPVLGASEELPSILSVQSVECVIVASSKIPDAKLRGLMLLCRERGVQVLSGRVGFDPITVEDDLAK